MRISTHLRKIGDHIFRLALLLLVLVNVDAFAQSTSWRGTTSNDWNTASNWTNGVPTATSNVFIGDGSFTGTNHPEIDESGVVSMADLTLSNESAKSVKLFVTNNFNVNISGKLTVGLGTTFENNGTTIVLQGDLENNGTIVESTFIKNNGRKGRFYPSFEMSGVGKKIAGTNTVTFSHLIVSGSIFLENNVTIETMNITVTGQNEPPTSDITVKANASFDPRGFKVTFRGKGTSSSDTTNGLIVEPGGTLYVKATNYTDNYTIVPTTLYTTSVIDYAASTGTQYVLNRAYGILKISGGGTKELIGNTTVSNIDAATQLIVESGTLDLKTFTLNRTSGGTAVAGGTLTVSNGAFLRIGGTGAFPTGYNTVNLGPTSTVDYYGGNQAVDTRTYGHLILSGTGNKAMPATAFTVAGNFSSSGTVAYTANSDFTVLGDVSIGTGTTFDGSTRTITVGGNWTDNGTFTPATSTIVMNGSGKQVLRSAVGAAPFNNISITTGLISTAVNINVLGNFGTSGAGQFTSTATLTMSGAAKTISGENITLANFFADGTTTTTATLAVNGNLTVNSGKSFIATAGVINMQGSGTSIVNNGTFSPFSIRILGTTSTTSSFTVTSNLSGTGTLTATGGTITFDGTTTYGGTHLLHNVTVANSRTLTMNANSNMGIANQLTTTGATLNVSTNTPNTITYNRVGTQSINGRDYFNLVIANSGAKTAVGAISVLGNMTVASGSRFEGGNFTHSIKGDLINNAGSEFAAGSSRFVFDGTINSRISGTNTVFNQLEVNKSVASSYLELANSVQATDLLVTSGSMRTLSNTVTVTSSRSGNGWIYGTIRRQHAYTNGTAYAFAGPYNLITLNNASGITAVTVTNTSGVVSTFKNGTAINRAYDVSINGGTSPYAGTLQLQYNDADLNGNNEASIQLFKLVASNWEANGSTGRETNQNWVANNTLTDVTGSWTLSASAGILRWAGAISTDWGTAGNWLSVATDGSTTTSTKIPEVTDIVEFGVATVTNQPRLTTAASVKAIQFLDSGTPITLTLSGAGAQLTSEGNLVANGAGASSRTNTIIIDNAAGKLNVKGALILSGGTNNNLALNIGPGTVSVTGELEQKNTSSISIASGLLELNGDYSYTGGVFSASANSTVDYKGTGSQKVAAVSYHHLIISKPSGVATLNAAAALNFGGNLTMSGPESLVLQASDLTVSGNVEQTNGTIDVGSSVIKVAGNWTRTGGVFIPSASTVTFTGTNNSAIGSISQPAQEYTFNNLTVAKTAGITLTANNNIKINADFGISSGTLSLGTKTVSRNAPGGKFTMGNTGVLLLEGSNFPSNFVENTLDAASHVKYEGTASQAVAAVTYGHLTLDNGGAVEKTLQAGTRVNGDLTITDDATLDGAGKTLTISGNFTKASTGVFIAGATYTDGTLVLAGTTPAAQKQLNGAFTVHNMLLEAGANYVIPANDLLIKGNFTNQGTIDGTTRRVTFESDFLNSETGVLKSSGVAAFSGTRLQTIQLRAPIQGSVPHPLNPAITIPPAVEFNGNVAPVLNSTAAPSFGKVTINNQDPAGIRTSVGWTVNLDFNVSAGATFDGGAYTHNFLTAILNSGTILSSGTINFTPSGLAGLSAYPIKFGATPTAFRSTGTLYIGSSQLVALSGVVPSQLNNLTIDNKHTLGVTTQGLSAELPLYGTSWTINGNLSVLSGAKFNAGAGTTYIIGGNLVNSGTLNGAGGSFTLNNSVGLANDPVTPASIDGSGTTTLGNLTIATNANVDINSNLNVNGNLVYNGQSLSTTGAEINFTGTGASQIEAASGTLNIENIRVSKTDAATTVTLLADITETSNITVQSGTLDLSTKSVTKPTGSTSSTLTVFDNAFLKIGGTSAMPAFDVFSLGQSSTVEFYGSNQDVESIQYGHLSIKNAGTKTFKAGTAKIAGNFTVTTDPVVVTPATIEYNGTAAQTVAAIDYKNLSLITSSNKTLAAGTVGVAETFTNSGNATVNATANATTVNYNGAAVQDVLPMNYHNIKLSNSGIKTFSNTTGVAAAFTVEGTAEANLTSSETTLDFNGTGAQNIPALNYSKVLISAGGTKSLSGGNANIQKELRLTNGKITTSTNKFILENAATIVESEGNYVTGLVETQRNMTTAMETFGGIGISVTPAVSPGTVTVLRETGKTITASNGNTSILRNFLFTVVGTNSKLDATVTFNYFTDELGTFDENTLLLYYSSNGLDWMHNGSSIPDPTNNRLGANGIQSLTRMTLGSTVSPLPVEMKYFRAERRGQEAVLSWETAAERDHQGFEVEVSVDGKAYRRLGAVGSGRAGSSPGAKYSFTDTEAGKAGVRYYRLKQLDLDGTHAYYGPRAVDFGQAKDIPLQAYPNPFQDQLTVEFQAAINCTAKLSLHTIEGRKVYEENHAAKAGMNTVRLLFNSYSLKAGLYLLKVEAEDGSQTIKVIKK